MLKKLSTHWFLIVLLSVIVIHAGLLARLALFAYPELFVYPYLAQNGFLPYTQIFDQHFPSFLMLPINFYDLGLRSVESARVFLLGLVVFSHLLIFLIARNLFKDDKKAILANFLYLLLQPLFDGNTLWLDSFLVPILLFAFYFSLRLIQTKKSFYAIYAGLAVGLSIFLKQVMLPLIVFVAAYLFYKTKDYKKIFLFMLAGSLPLALVVIWIESRGLLSEFFYWSVQFNFEVYAAMGRKFPTLSQFVRFLIFWTPAFYWVAIKRKEKKLALLGIFMFVSLATAISRFELIHLQPSLPFAVLLTSAFFFSGKSSLRFAYALLFFLTIIVWSARFYKLNLRDYTYFFDATTLETSDKVVQLTKSNERIFILGAQPIIYFLSDRLPAGNVFSANLPWNMKVGEDKILKALLNDKPKVVVRDTSAKIDGVYVLEFANKLNLFVNEFYEEIDEIGPNQVLVLRQK